MSLQAVAIAAQEQRKKTLRNKNKRGQIHNNQRGCIPVAIYAAICAAS